ncbi:hypothetical protein CVV72_05800 [Amycolatopsis sp. TNS106]|nr:hypothetical protein CVV72_05800 [Amycolatopsis sp. TNS106]
MSSESTLALLSRSTRKHAVSTGNPARSEVLEVRRPGGERVRAGFPWRPPSGRAGPQCAAPRQAGSRTSAARHGHHHGGLAGRHDAAAGRSAAASRHG